MARKGVTSFHYSVEHWQNPMAVHTESDYNSMRIGWDIIIDIDSKLGIEESQIAALTVIEMLEKYSILPGVKFSGLSLIHI